MGYIFNGLCYWNIAAKNLILHLVTKIANTMLCQRILFTLSLFAALLFTQNMGQCQTNVLTQHNNLKRTGWNNTETVLTQAGVANSFGRLFNRAVDDQIYAQPLVMSNILVGGKKHNVVFTATVNNSLYAFDADDSAAMAPLWHVNLTYNGYRPIQNNDMTGACGGYYQDFSGKMGIVGTPVIDSASGTLYVVARSVSANGVTFVQYLHAIDIVTGAEKAGSPVYITAKVPGNGDGNNGAGYVEFDQQHENPRPGLLLYNGVVYISWASHCDWSPYHGWIIGYDYKTLAQKYVYNTSPNGGLAGIWMSGQAPAVDDSGYIYVSTGNGTIGYNGNPKDTINRGESVLKLKPTGNVLKVVDYFTPDDYQYLEDNDLDYGVDGVLLLPNTNISLSGSKESYLYVINNSKMGGIANNNANTIQMLDVNASATFYAKHLHGSPVYYKSNTGQEYVYAWAEGGLLKQFPFNRAAGNFDTANKKVGNTTLPGGMPGSMMSLSSNGSQSGTGILWASHPLSGDANQAVVPGELQAFDATNVTHELWNSNWNASRDGVGNFGKFVCPTVANGKVYLATFSNNLSVYGLNPTKTSTCAGSTLPAGLHGANVGYLGYPGDVCYNSGTYTITSSGTDIWDTQDAFYYTYQQFNPSSGEIIARVKSMANTDQWAKCGVMFRQSLDAGSPHAFMAITVGNGQAFQNRVLAGDVSYNTNNGNSKAPYWVRLVKKGDKYIGYTSPDGKSWTAIDSISVALGDFAYAGIAYTTHDNTVSGTAVVDSVKFISHDVLAIGLGKLTGKNNNNEKAFLNWTSANEQRGDRFNMERSDDGVHFSLVGTTAITVGAGTHQYSFTDAQPLAGSNYYRVAQVSVDGTVKFSNTLLLTFNTYTFNVYPNPVRNQLFIRYFDDLGPGKKISLQLINTAGQRVFQQQIPLVSNATTYIINIPQGLSSGVYVAQVVNAKGEQRTRKVFVER